MNTMSMSDVDAYILMYHLGELTTSEADLLATILQGMHATDLLDLANYEALTGPILERI